jgi:hypothetical protein
VLSNVSGGQKIADSFDKLLVTVSGKIAVGLTK